MMLILMLVLVLVLALLTMSRVGPQRVIMS
jgi:hypothetical protein